MTPQEEVQIDNIENFNRCRTLKYAAQNHHQTSKLLNRGFIHFRMALRCG